MLAQPAQSLTDLLLGLVTVLSGWRLSRGPARCRHWVPAFYWFGFAALLGALHHGVIVRWPRIADVSWGVISIIVVVGVSYVLAATVAETLGPGRAWAFWLLRSVGFVAYVSMVATGHAGIRAILWCESLTMLSVLVLWAWAAYQRNPMAPMALLAIAASMAAAGTKALNRHDLRPLHLDPTSAYHLAQIVGTVLLYAAVQHSLRTGSQPNIERDRGRLMETQPMRP
ncbi:DUF6962 family protein [Jatrophihabitans sp. DSM 45814]